MKNPDEGFELKNCRYIKFVYWKTLDVEQNNEYKNIYPITF